MGETRPDPRRPESWCREGVTHNHDACGLLWNSADQRDIAAAVDWAERVGPAERLEAKAAELHAAGWFIAAPEKAADVRTALESVGCYEEDWTDREWRPAAPTSHQPQTSR